MEIAINQIIEASNLIQSVTPEEKVIVLGVDVYKEIKEHVTIVLNSDGNYIDKINGIECHYSVVIPRMNYMVITREQFNRFKQEEKEFLEQLNKNK